MSDSRGPIGVFDSGLGGLSVLRAVRTLLPHEEIVYVADSGNAPYGGRDDAFIVERSLAISDWLLEQGAKAMVIACNTATAQAVHVLRSLTPIPLVGVEPGLKPAALLSKSHVAGVLATASTLRSEKFRRLLAEHQGTCRFLCQPGHGLVEAIERGDTDSAELVELLSSYLAPMLAEGADTLVLGCTHYPFIDGAIRRIAGEQLAIIDTSVAIARQLVRLLSDRALLISDGENATPCAVRLCTTGDPAPLATVARTLLDLHAPVENLSLPTSRSLGGSAIASV
jgi:glutamate racemase